MEQKNNVSIPLSDILICNTKSIFFVLTNDNIGHRTRNLSLATMQAYHPLFVVCCAFIMAVSVYEQPNKKVKFRAFKTEENEIKTLKIAAIRFYFLFLCLLWRFKARNLQADFSR